MAWSVERTTVDTLLKEWHAFMAAEKVEIIPWFFLKWQCSMSISLNKTSSSLKFLDFTVDGIKSREDDRWHAFKRMTCIHGSWKSWDHPIIATFTILATLISPGLSQKAFAYWTKNLRCIISLCKDLEKIKFQVKKANLLNKIQPRTQVYPNLTRAAQQNFFQTANFDSL